MFPIGNVNQVNIKEEIFENKYGGIGDEVEVGDKIGDEKGESGSPTPSSEAACVSLFFLKFSKLFLVLIFH